MTRNTTDTSSKARRNEDDIEDCVAQKLSLLPEHIKKLTSGSVDEKTESCMAIRKLLSVEHSPPIRPIVDAGVVSLLVQQLVHDDAPKLQFEACWALTNIASGDSSYVNSILNAGALTHLVSLLESPNIDVCEQAIWAIGNIAGESAQIRDTVLNTTALTSICKIIAGSPRISLLRNATWTLSNLCRGKPLPAFTLVSHSIPVLANLLYCNDDDVLVDATWAISFLSDGPNERIDAIIQSGVVKRLAELLLHPSAQIAALRAIGNIATGNDSQTQTLLNTNMLSSIPHLLSHQKKSVRKEACWTISNITAGNRAQIKQVIDHGIIPPLVNLLNQDDFDVKKEAIWALSNATSGGSEEQIDYLVQKGCIASFCAQLSCKDAKMISVALEGLQNILQRGAHLTAASENPYAIKVEECGGLDSLEKLQEHPNRDIYEKAVRLLEDFFDAEEEVDNRTN